MAEGQEELVDKAFPDGEFTKAELKGGCPTMPSRDPCPQLLVYGWSIDVGCCILARECCLFDNCLRCPEGLGRINALSNQEAKLVLKQFSMANTAASKLWAMPGLAAKAMDYLDKLEPKTDVQHRDTVSRFRE